MAAERAGGAMFSPVEKTPVFPAWLQHSVVPSRSALDRVSIAFNVALKGLIGGESGRLHF
jgi:hypothetical protein